MKTVSFLENITFKKDKPAVTMLLETDFSKETRIAFRENQLMKDHKAPFPITVQVVKGNIDFGVLGEIKHLKTGDLILLDANMIHNLTALEESVVRLTLSKKDTEKRVKKL